MLANVVIVLPFGFDIPEGTFGVRSWDQDGYRVQIDIPRVAAEYPIMGEAMEVIANGVKTFRANALRIVFQQDNFERVRLPQGVTVSVNQFDEPSDPPLPLVFEVANAFLARLRYVTRDPEIRPISSEEADLSCPPCASTKAKISAFEASRRVRAFLGGRSPRVAARSRAQALEFVAGLRSDPLPVSSPPLPCVAVLPDILSSSVKA